MAANLFPLIMNQLSVDTEWDVRKEATWVLCNIISSRNKEYIVLLIELGIVEKLCLLLEINDLKVLIIVLESIEIILQVDKSLDNKYNVTTRVDECEGEIVDMLMVNM